MTMLPTLNFPDKQPRWATNVGRTLEPDESIKDDGWLVGEKPPARWMNWLQNLVSEWAQRVGLSFVSNWFDTGDFFAADEGVAITYHSTLGFWMAIDQTAVNPKVWISFNGRNWSTPHSLAAPLNDKCIGIDTTRYLCPLSNGNIEYSTDGSVTWATDTGPSITNITAIETKYPASDFAIIGDTAGAIEIASGGVGTSWVSPTTSPSYSATAQINRIAFMGGSNWILCTVGGETFVSTDDGDNWSATSQHPKDIAGFSSASHMSYNAAESTVVVFGQGTGGNVAYYSNNDGQTWTASTITLDQPGSPEAGFDFGYYCGGSIWIAGGSSINIPKLNMFVSYNNGENWTIAEHHTDFTPTNGKNLFHAGCNGRMIVAVGGEESTENGFAVNSLAVTGSMNG